MAFDELFTFHDNFLLNDTCIDPLFDPPQPYDHRSFFFTPNNLSPPLPEFFPDQQYLLIDSTSSNFVQQQYEYCCPKRQKATRNYDYMGGGILVDTTTSTNTNFFPFLNIPPPGSFLFPDLPLEMLTSPLLDHPDDVQTTYENGPMLLPDFSEVYSCGSSCSEHVEGTCVGVNEKKGSNLSPQSIAARVRRKKIREKTQELGKLIPGGHKMNTAEMFQAASKYIKFLQAQAGILHSMPSLQEDNEGRIELGCLVTSPLVQEKLYMAEKCLVAKNMIEISLANDHQLQSKPQLLKNNIIKIDSVYFVLTYPHFRIQI